MSPSCKRSLMHKLEPATSTLPPIPQHRDLHHTFLTTQRHDGSELDPNDALAFHEAAVTGGEVHVADVNFDGADVVDQG